VLPTPRNTTHGPLPLLLLAWLLPTALIAQDRNLGAFTSAADVGAPAIAGTTAFTPAAGEYRMTAAGANMWAKQDPT
jgi:hypothetical protein